MKTKTLLIAVLALLCSTMTKAQDFEVDGIRYDIISFTELTVKASSISETIVGDLAIPSKVEFSGKILKVLEVSDDFASSNLSISSLSVDDGIISIGARAFKNCANLATVDIAHSVTCLGEECFYGCSALDSFCNSGIVTMGVNSFAECKSLKEVSMESLESLQQGTFLNCPQLLNCNLPKINSIGKEAFKNCQSLKEYCISNGVITIGESAFEGCASLITMIFPNNVKELEKGIFTNCTALTSISIGAGISYLPWIFEGCTNLSDVRIEDSTTTLEFGYTGERTYFDKGSDRINYVSRSYSPSSAMFVGVDLSYLYIGRNITTEIYCYGEEYLSGSYDLRYYYYIPNPPFSGSKISILEIGFLVSDLRMCEYKDTRYSDRVYVYGEWNGTFQNCTNLDSIILHSTATDIPESTFYGCNRIESLEIPNRVTEIGRNAFYGCASLKNISLGNSIATIGNKAFEGCDSLIEINIKSPNPPTYNTGFSSANYINTKVNVPTGYLKKYQEAEPWRNFWNLSEKNDLISLFEVDGIKYSVINNNNVEIIGNGISTLTELCIKNKVEYYGNCYNVVSISDLAFKGCSYLSFVKIEDGVISIGKSSFEDCGNLKTIAMPSNLQNLDVAAFKNCLLLDSVILPQSITMMPFECFSGCKSLNSISIPANVVIFENNVFSGCTGLKELIFEDSDNPLILPNGAYEGATGIQKKSVNGKTIQFKIQYYKPCFSGLPIEKLYLGRNLSKDSRYTISGDGGVDYYLITSYDAPFGNLYKLKELTIGENVDVLGPEQEYISEVDLYVTPGSFKNCSSIQRVDVKSQIPPSGAEFSTTVYNNAKLHVPDNTYSKYSCADGWKEFVNMIIPPDTIVLDKKTIIMNVGGVCKISATVYPENTTDKTIIWVSSDDSVVKVSDSGEVVGVSEGKATITASCGNISAMCEVEVIAAQTYTVTYIVDGEVYATDSIAYGSEIVLRDEPTKEGHTFSGWSEAPETMPAEDIVIEGSFSVNSYSITYKVDGEVYATDSIAYGSEIVLRDEPVKEGHTFSGWSDVPETMPANDITIEGTFSINSYTVTFMIDGEVYETATVEFGAEIELPTPPEKDGYIFGGWVGVPDSMPAQDVVIEGEYIVDTTGINDVKTESSNVRTVYDLRGRKVDNPTNGIYIVNGKKVFVK